MPGLQAAESLASGNALLLTVQSAWLGRGLSVDSAAAHRGVSVANSESRPAAVSQPPLNSISSDRAVPRRQEKFPHLGCDAGVSPSSPQYSTLCYCNPYNELVATTSPKLEGHLLSAVVVRIVYDCICDVCIS